MKKRFTEEQIIGALGKLSAGTTAKELSREIGVSQQTLYSWKRKFGGMDVSEAIRQPERSEGSIPQYRNPKFPGPSARSDNKKESHPIFPKRKHQIALINRHF